MPPEIFVRVIDWARGWLQAVPHPLCDPKPYSPQPYTLNPLQADKVEIHGGQANVVQTSKEVDLKLRKKVTVKKTRFRWSKMSGRQFS